MYIQKTCHDEFVKTDDYLILNKITLISYVSVTKKIEGFVLIEKMK